ncbi:MAG TPA: galactose-1-phosphate uridylyltransferase [Candidatus Acidoferrum sp.]|nr:galactose-1-phosphate uridylyltransferase [Candidatus Acidoferrum sp.]
MPEFRKDPTVDRWVIIATERAKRPIRREGSDTALCPFCAGNENMTPPEVLVFRDVGDPSRLPNWTVRVVPNKYPALVPDGSRLETTNEIYEARSGTGTHEVIIESPHHVTDVTLLNENQFEAVLRAYRNRIMDLRNDRRFRYILIYKNQGTEAGATLEHVHSQLIAMPMIPKLILEEIETAKNYYQGNRRCVFCDVIRKETASERFVTENARYLVICPFAPRFPYETWILPKQHALLFERNTQPDDVDLAGILRETLIRLNRSLGGPAFNYFIHSNPLDQGENSYYHWHMEIIPKLIQVGGFEWGSGSYINTVTPEQSARSLRAAIP